MPDEPRVPPSIWVTALPKLMAGDNACEWAAWLPAHFWKYDHKPFDNPTWLIQHTELMNQIGPELKAEWSTVTRERQNSFDLLGSVGTLSGRPDFVAISETKGLICDAKAANPSVEHHIQLAIYMWALPQLTRWKGIEFDGVLVYKDHKEFVSAGTIDDSFKTSLRALLKRVGGASPAPKVPSYSECLYCSIRKSECPDRVETPDKQEGVGDF